MREIPLYFVGSKIYFVVKKELGVPPMGSYGYMDLQVTQGLPEGKILINNCNIISISLKNPEIRHYIRSTIGLVIV